MDDFRILSKSNKTLWISLNRKKLNREQQSCLLIEDSYRCFLQSFGLAYEWKMVWSHNTADLVEVWRVETWATEDFARNQRVWTTDIPNRWQRTLRQRKAYHAITGWAIILLLIFAVLHERFEILCYSCNLERVLAVISYLPRDRKFRPLRQSLFSNQTLFPVTDLVLGNDSLHGLDHQRLTLSCTHKSSVDGEVDIDNYRHKSPENKRDEVVTPEKSSAQNLLTAWQVFQWPSSSDFPARQTIITTVVMLPLSEATKHVDSNHVTPTQTLSDVWPHADTCTLVNERTAV